MPPVVIAGGIAAAGAIGGAVLSSKAQKSAASQANASQQEATQAQLQLGRESMALNQNIYNSNYDVLSPYASRGNVAGDSINALLGLPQAPVMHSPLAAAPATGTPAPTTGGVPATGVPQTTVSPGGGVNTGGFFHAVDPGARPGGGVGFGNTEPGMATPSNPTGAIPGTISALNGTPATGAPAGATATPPGVTPMSATTAMNNFANSAGMQFALQSGAKSVNMGAGANGWLESGAALKALQANGQNIALQQYFPMYTGLLGQQQAVGAGAASSIAGVGANFGNTAANINNGMGANIQSGANAASNAALLRGAATGQMYNGIGSAIGGFASSFVPAR